ncbi:uncharacterized protein LOC110892332 [Helianthus annuus]|uniref:uncharacterized protein LOC110892332 n=1 Tax=Helianthus annuus TaxID=4232 RepID=UPI000B8EF2E0|nr:uncharacterized protein LOC110892332 [Helianthus annuus]
MGDKLDSSAAATKPNALHPAYSVTNIQSKIRTLDGTTVTYSSWVQLFQLHVVAYMVADHIDGTDSPPKAKPSYAQWKELDALVLQWILSTVSDNILPRILPNTTSAKQAWDKLEKIYLSIKEMSSATGEDLASHITGEMKATISEEVGKELEASLPQFVDRLQTTLLSVIDDKMNEMKERHTGI